MSSTVATCVEAPTADGDECTLRPYASVNDPWAHCKIDDGIVNEKDKEQDLPIYRFTLVAAMVRNLDRDFSALSVTSSKYI